MTRVIPLVLAVVSGQYYQTLKDEGTAKPKRAAINLTGSAVTCTDDYANNQTTCDVSTAGGTSHTLISATHTDTTGTPAQGDVLYRNGSSQWTRLAKGTSGQVLHSGDAPSWSSIADGDLANNYSGTGACGANTFASTLNDNASPTCTQPAFSNLSGTATMAQGGTGVTSISDDQLIVGTGASTTANKTLPDCDTAATSKLLYDTTTNAFSCGTDQTGGTQTARLTGDYTIASTTGTEVSGLRVTLSASGVYRAEYWLLTQSSATGTGMKYGINYTGTVTAMSCVREYPSTGTTQATGVADDTAAILTGSLMESDVTRVETTTAPDLGPNTGTAASDVNILQFIRCVLVVSDAGDLELWSGSEGAVTTRIMTGSNVIVTNIP